MRAKVSIELEDQLAVIGVALSDADMLGEFGMPSTAPLSASARGERVVVGLKPVAVDGRALAPTTIGDPRRHFARGLAATGAFFVTGVDFGLEMARSSFGATQDRWRCS
jgi:hypothetical protein